MGIMAYMDCIADVHIQFIKVCKTERKLLRAKIKNQRLNVQCARNIRQLDIIYT